ncbi:MULTISPECIES: PAC2 family protein [Streptomyces]|uniref:PAC2 family protein n=1 Tax=Streptomyces xinghaiensis TaxID=1038928 RepID=A0A3M8F888_9ACTN|nr:MULTISPECIES: PAC2 family protein [Streptomyces]PQM22564.1 PAC2 family protein [Streptomyces xinghaiensis]RKM96469.1 PAC2 family protein [Streptomyces xinghaiensis]RNC74379.1 PAC2 family protein [Streptomyces xinghaiensis]
MIELEGVPELIDPVMVAAFEGWNDAGDAASAAVVHLDREWKGEVFAALDAEDYYDFQVNRPTVFLEDGVRKITWPTTRLSVVRVGGEKPRDLVLVRGIEPSMRWRSFCNELLGFAHELGVEMIVILGALLGDTPHTRPVPVSGVTSDPQLARTMDLEETRYEGPTGIVGVLQEACTHAGVPAVSLWAAVPHYVSQPPNPKATLALLNRLEDLIGLRVPTGELVEDARAWQLGVDQLAAEDSEVAEYVQTLEEARDTAELPEASGEAIAREFERYLRRRDGRPGAAPGGHATETGSTPEGRDSGAYLRDPSAGTGRPAKPVTPEDTAGDASGRPADGEGTDVGRGTPEGGPGQGDAGQGEAGEDGTGGRGKAGNGRGGRSRPRGRTGHNADKDKDADKDGNADSGPSGAGSGKSGGGDGTEDGPGAEDE